MRQLPEIEATYTRIAELFDSWIEQAQESGENPVVENLIRKRRLNEEAYFLLIWGQFEDRVNAVCSKAIRKRRSSEEWETRRAWDAYDPDSMRFRFEDRLALVLDRHNSVNDSYRRAVRLYGLRNQIAHGRSIASGVDIPQIIEEIYRLIANLRD